MTLSFKAHKKGCLYIEKILVLLTPLLLTTFFGNNNTYGQSHALYATQIDSLLNVRPQGAPEVKGIDYSSGNVTKNVPLATVEGFTLSIQYSSEGVERKALTRNIDASTGIVGLGWSLPEYKIVRQHNGTGSIIDDTYYLKMGAGLDKLIYIKTEDEIIHYTTASNPEWELLYHLNHDQWKVLFNDGTQFVFGDGNLNEGFDANSTEKLVHWGNWIGSSADTTGQEILSSVWNVSLKKDIRNQVVKFHYKQVYEQVGVGGKKYTKACYLDTVIGHHGWRVQLDYEDKEATEYADPHTQYKGTPENDQDAYQELFETQYLSKLTRFNHNNQTVDIVELGYEFLNKNDSNFTKRLLASINYKNAYGNEIHPSVTFDYYGLKTEDGLSVGLTYSQSKFSDNTKGALLAALKAETTPEGATYTYKYGEKVVDSSFRDIQLIFPEKLKYKSLSGDSTHEITWAAPELFFGSDYVVALYEAVQLDYYYTHVQVYEWVGDKWVLGHDEPVYGIYHDNYRAYDYYDEAVVMQIKDSIMAHAAKYFPGIKPIMNALNDAIKDEVKIYTDLLKDDVPPGKKVETFFKDLIKVPTDIGLDLASGFFDQFSRIKKEACQILQIKNCNYNELQKELYHRKDSLEKIYPRKEFHITLQKDFFAMLSSENGHALYAYRKDPLVDGKWNKSAELVGTASKHFNIQSGEDFITVHDEILNTLFITYWNEKYWKTIVKHISLDASGFSDILPMVDYTKTSSAMAAGNNFIVAVVKPQNTAAQMKVEIFYHDEQMNWTLKSEYIEAKMTIGQATENAFNTVLGKNGKLLLKTGPTFAALQSYNNLNTDYPLDILIDEIYEETVGSMLSDYHKFNTTYSITWNKNFESINANLLHYGWAQTDVGIQINGDVINKIGRSSTVLDTIAFTDNGLNLAFRYKGNGNFVENRFRTRYLSSAFAEDVSSIVVMGKQGVDYKTPKFYGFNPNTLNPKNNTSGKSSWHLIEGPSDEEILTAELVDEIINITAEKVNQVIQIVLMVIPGAGEEMAVAEEAMSSVKSIVSVSDIVTNVVPYVLQSAAIDLANGLVKINPNGTSVLNDYIGVNGKIFNRQQDESWKQVTQKAFDDPEGKLIGNSNRLMPGFYPFTLRDGQSVKNRVSLLKNGAIYRNIDLQMDTAVVHQDSLSSVNGYGAFVSYGPLDDSKIGFVAKNPDKEAYLDLILPTAAERKAHGSYSDATSVRLHKVIGDDVAGKLTDYVVKQVEINDGRNKYYHHFEYESGKYDASSGSAIYGKVLDVTSPIPSPSADYDIKKLGSAGYTAHYFYNKYNYSAQENAVGYPAQENTQPDEPLVEYKSFMHSDSLDYRNNSIKQLERLPYLTSVYDVNDSLISRNRIDYKLWGTNLFHTYKDTNLHSTSIYLVKPLREINMQDGVVTKKEHNYELYGVPNELMLAMLPRSITEFSTAMDGQEEKTTTYTKYAFEYDSVLMAKNRLTEVKSHIKQYQKGNDKPIFLSGTTVTYDSTMHQLKGHYTAKLYDDLNTDSIDDAIKALEDVLLADTAIFDYETRLYDLEIALGNYNKASNAAIAAHKAADDAHDKLVDLTIEIKNLEKVVNFINNKMIQIHHDDSVLTAELKDAQDSLNSAVRDTTDEAINNSPEVKNLEDLKDNVWAYCAGTLAGTAKFAAFGAAGVGIIGGSYLACVFGAKSKINGLIDTKKKGLKKAARERFKTAQDNLTKVQDEKDNFDRINEFWLKKKSELENEIKTAKPIVDNLADKVEAATEKWAKHEKNHEPFLQNKDHWKVSTHDFHDTLYVNLDKTADAWADAGNHIGKVKGISSLTMWKIGADSLGMTETFDFDSTKLADSMHEHAGSLRSLSDKHIAMDSLQDKLWKILHATNGHNAKWIEESRVHQYDTVKRIPISWEDTRNTRHSILLDKYHRNIIAHFSNADVNTGEAFYYGFEPYEKTPSADKTVRLSKDAYTGDCSLLLKKANYFRFAGFDPEPNKFFADSIYVVSAWVKKLPGSGSSWLYLMTGDGSRYKTKAKKKDGWQHLEWVFNQGTPNCNSFILRGKNVIVDDILIRPLNSEVSINTYDTFDKPKTSLSNNGLKTKYIYDADHNLATTIDATGNISDIVVHGYKRNEKLQSGLERANSSLHLHFIGKGYAPEPAKNNVFEVEGTNHFLADFAIYIPSIPDTTGSIWINADELQIMYAHGNYQVNGQQIIHSSEAPKNLIFVFSGRQIFCYENGKPLWHKPFEFKTLEHNAKITVSGAKILNVIVGEKPILSQVYSDGLGRTVQSQQLIYDPAGNSNGKSISEIVYDGWGNKAIVTPAAFDKTPALTYSSDFIKSINWATGKLTGDVSQYFLSKVGEIPNLKTEDSEYCYHRTIYEASPAHRVIRNILPGAHFHLQNSQQQVTSYQDSKGSKLANEIKIPAKNVDDFHSKNVASPNNNNTSILHDKMNRVVAQGDDDLITQHIYGFNTSSFVENKTLHPNFFKTNDQSAASGNWYTDVVNNYDMLGLLSTTYDPDEGHLTVIKDFSGKPAFYVRARDNLRPSDNINEIPIHFIKYDELGRHIAEGVDTTIFKYPLLETMANSGFWDDENLFEFNTWTYNIDKNLNAKNLKGRLSSSTHYSQGQATTETYTYDARGNITSVTQNIKWPNKKVSIHKIGYDYWPDNKLKAITYPDGETVNYLYDKLGHLSGVGSNSNPYYYARYSYTIDGKVDEVLLNNLTLKQYHKYDLQNHLVELGYTSDTTKLFAQNLQYNSTPGSEPYLMGNITQISEVGSYLDAEHQQSFEYDTHYRLTKASDKSQGQNQEYSYSYDANGNILAAQNPSGKVNYAYKQGSNIRNTISTIDGLVNSINSGAGDVVLGYNPHTRLPLIAQNKQSNIEASYGYNTFNERVTKTRHSTSINDTTIYVHGKHQLPLIKTKSGNKDGAAYKYTTNLIYGLDYAPLTGVHNKAFVLYHLRDHLGSLRYAAGGKNQPLANYSYDPYGVTTAKVDTTLNGIDPPSYLYTGQEYEEELGLYNYRARLYSPTQSIFLGTDPVRQGSSPFAYVGDNPINHTDPDGRMFGRFLNFTKQMLTKLTQSTAVKSEVSAALRGARKELTHTGVLHKQGHGSYTQAPHSRHLPAKETHSGELVMYRGEHSPRPDDSHFASYAARNHGDAYAERLIQEGDISLLKHQHALDSRSPASPFVSVTSDLRVAKSFAGHRGTVFTLHLNRDRALFNEFNKMEIGGGISESESLVPIRIRKEEIAETTKLK